MSIDIHPPKPTAPLLTPPEVRQQESVVTSGAPRYSVYDHETNKVTVMSSRLIPIPTAEDAEKFTRLVTRWRQETQALSSDSDIVANFAYHQIMGMGERALPLIFEEMEAHGGRWFWALRAITGENPVRPEDRGNVRRMTETWLKWARDHKYV